MYRIELIPRGIWIITVIAGLLIILLAFSVAVTRSRGEVVVIGPEVETGNPADYVKQPTPPSAPAQTRPPVVTPVPSQPPAPPSTAPAGLPQTIAFGGSTWQFSEGPVQVNAVTTGRFTDNHIIYRKQGDQPPYEALYLESAPNSGQFYKYVPATGQSTVNSKR